jgi:hypothetical protein
LQKEITAKKAPRIFYTKLQKEIAVKEKSITDNIREIIKRNHNKRNKKKWS